MRQPVSSKFLLRLSAMDSSTTAASVTNVDGIDGLHYCATAGDWVTAKLSQRSTITGSRQRIETISVRFRTRQTDCKSSKRSGSLFFWDSAVLKSTAGRYPGLGEPSATIPVRLGAWANRRPLSWFVQGLAVGRYPGLPCSSGGGI